MYTCVNTPQKLIDMTDRVNTKATYMTSMRQMMGYFRVALNIETADEYFKVY